METAMTLTQRDNAMMLHNEIMQRGAAAAGALADFCESLKKMRDSELYRELGCEDFESYCEKCAGIKARMAYNYIASYERLGDEYVREHAMLGITKLEVLSRMQPEDREEAAVSAAEMSVSELKDLQEKLSVAGRQIGMLSEELEAERDRSNALDGEIERLKAEENEKLRAAEEQIATLTEQIKTAEGAAAEIPEETLAKIRAEADKKASASLKAGEKAAADKARAEAEKTIEKEKEAAKKAKEKAERLSAEKRACEAEIEKLKRRIAASDAAVAEVKVYFEQVKSSFNTMLEKISGCEGEMRAKLTGAAGKLLEACREALQESQR